MLTGLIIIIIASIQVTRNSTSIYKLSEIFLSEFAYCIVSEGITFYLEYMGHSTDMVHNLTLLPHFDVIDNFLLGM